VTLLASELLPGVAPPLLAGLLFAAHPVHVEAVAGIVGRAELLAACGIVAGVLMHRRALQAAAEGRPVRSFMVGAWIASFLGLMAKESAATAPLLCGLVDRAFPASPGPPPGRRLALYAGHGVFLSFALLARRLALGSFGVGAPIPFVDNPAASAGPLDGRLTALGTLPRYAALLLWPQRLSADYSFDQIPLIHSLSDPWALGGLLLLFGVLVGGAWSLRRAPALGVSLLWVAVSACLTVNLLVFIGTLEAERLMYAPSIGVCLLAGWCLARLQGIGEGRAAVAAGLALVCVAGLRTSWRVPEWKDDFALYLSAARVSPRSARIRYNLGNAYLRRGSYGEAEENYRTALEIYPDYNDARVNLGMAVLELGRPAEALGLLKTAAARLPGSADIVVNLGAAYRALGDVDRARGEFRRALGIDRRSARAWNNLGSLALAGDDLQESVEDLRRAVECEPDYAIYRVNLDDALDAVGRPLEADEQFEAAFRIDPGLPEAHRGLGEVALRRGDSSTAEREFRIAAAGEPPSARAANFLGYLLARRGDAEGAAAQYERAVRIDPRLADAHRSLGLIYAQKLGDRERGARELEITLSLAPDQPGATDLRKLMEALRR